MVEAAVEAMKTDGDLSGSPVCYINERVNLLSGGTLNLELKAVPKSIGRLMSIQVGFTNPF